MEVRKQFAERFFFQSPFRPAAASCVVSRVDFRIFRVAGVNVFADAEFFEVVQHCCRELRRKQFRAVSYGEIAFEFSGEGCHVAAFTAAEPPLDAFFIDVSAESLRQRLFFSF